MAGPTILQTSGAAPHKQAKYAPIFTNRFFTGLWTQRNPLRDPSDHISEKFYGGRPDALIDGANIELSNRLTLSRRPGLVKYSTQTVAQAPTAFYSFRKIAPNPGFGAFDKFQSGSGTGTAISTPSATPAYAQVWALQLNQSNGAVSNTESAPAGWSLFDVFPSGTAYGWQQITSAPIAGAATLNTNSTQWASLLLLFQLIGGSNPVVIQRVSNGGGFSAGTNTTNTFGSSTTTGNSILFAFMAGTESGDPAISSVFDVLGNGYTKLASVNAGGVNVTAWLAQNINAGLNNAVSWVQAQSTSNTTVFAWELGGGAANAQNIDVVVDTPSTVYQLTPTTIGTIFNKTAGSGQSFFQGVGNTLYFGDGLDQQKWNDFGSGVPGNNNGNLTNPTWNWGIATPPVVAPNVTNAPTLVITPSGSAATTWTASTVFSTMGLIVDGNGNVQQMTSVNATGTNTTQYGTTSNGEPNWNQTPGGTTVDNTITWTNWGPIPAWAPNFTYNNAALGGTLANPSQIYDPTSKAVEINIAPGNAQGTSGGQKPTFLAVQGANQHDPSNQNSPPAVKWFSIFPAPGRWKPTTSYPAFLGTDTASTCIIEPANLPALPGQTVFLQISGGGTSGASGTAPKFATVAGQLTSDGDLIWNCLGTATRANLTPYTAWPGNSGVFSVILVSGVLYVCTQSGTSASVAPTFDTAYGSKSTDGNVVWTSVGPSMSWAATTKWYLPLVGFSPPSGSSPYGGASVIDNLTPQHVQFVTQSGLSGAGPGQPAWNATQGGTTTDNAAIWTNVSVFQAVSLTWTKGHNWAFAFKARSATDPSVTVAPPGNKNPLGTPTGSASGHVSTATAAATITGPNTGAVVTISGVGSLDPQVDTIEIYRDLDGGGASNMFYLTDIPNPSSQGQGMPGTWSFQDSFADAVLNQLIPAPIAHSNDPPKVGFINPTYHFGRIWGSVGATVYCSGGPDTLTGNGNEAFPPVNSFQFPSIVTKLVPTSSGLLVFTTSDVFIIAGGPQITSFFDQIFIPNLGVLSYNAIDVEGGYILAFTSDSQFVSIDPTAGVSELGFAVGDKFAAFNPSKVYVTSHISTSMDKAIYVADGSTGWFRLNPSQVPDGGPVWSPKAVITNGCKAVQSIETSPGIHKLLVGATTANSFVLNRDLNTFTDNTSTYTAFATMGSFILAQPGQLAELSFITADFSAVGSQPTVSFLLDEISGTFTSFGSFVTDPTQLSSSVTVFGNRYYFNQTTAPAWCRHMQLKVAFAAEAFQNELLTLTIFGAHWQEE